MRWLGGKRDGVPLAAALVLVLAACSGGPDGPEVRRPGTAASPRDVNVILRDYVFVPDRIELFAGETVRFNLINGGLLPHEFVLGDHEVQRAWASAEAAATPPGPLATAPPASVPPARAGLRVLLGSGGQASVVYTVPAGARLAVACHIPGHLERGMAAEVRVIESR